MFWPRFIRIVGILSILTFSAGTMLLGTMFRDLEQGNKWKKALNYLTNFEDQFYDYRMKDTIDHERKIPQIVLARVDDESLQSVGKWPWRRQVWADMLTKFKGYGAKVLAFDVIFPEPELICGADNGDQAFSNSIKDFQSIPGNKVILAYDAGIDYLKYIDAHDGKVKENKKAAVELPEDMYNFILDAKNDEDYHLKQYYIDKTTYPIKKLLEAEPSLGYISNEPDFDGVFRYYPIAKNFDTMYFPSLALKAFMAHTGKSIRFEIFRGSTSAYIEDKPVHINLKGETKIRWIGDQRNFPGVSLKRVLEAPADDPELTKLLKGTMVFIGSTSTGAHDLRNTPINPTLPGVYSHMNMAYMLENSFFFKPENASLKYSVAIISIGVILLLIIQFFNNPVLDIIYTIGFIIGTYYMDKKYLIPDGYQIKLFFTYFSVSSIYSWNTLLNFSKSNAEKKQIRGTFSKYVAPDIVDEMLSHPEKLKVGGEKRDITCMFSDVRDFTSISEKLTPQDLSHCLNIYMGKMTDIVFDTHGTLDKYIGDAVVAYWGAPLDVPGHPQKAVLAAIQMIDAMPEVNEEMKKHGYPEFKIGIGLNSGVCSLGNMGSDKIFSYTALGDNMNLGARLEALCKYYGSLVTISEYTFDKLDPAVVRCRKLDKVRVKGKTEPVDIYEALHTTHYLKTNEEDYEKYQAAFDMYYNKQFQESLAIFKELHDKYPEDKPCIRYMEWNEAYIAEPPPADWDGIFTHTTKG